MLILTSRNEYVSILSHQSSCTAVPILGLAPAPWRQFVRRRARYPIRLFAVSASALRRLAGGRRPLLSLSLSLSLSRKQFLQHTVTTCDHPHTPYLYLRSMHTTHTQHTAGTVCRHLEKPSFESTWPLSLCRCSSHSLTVVPPQHSSSSRPVGPSRNSAPDPRRQTRPRSSIS